MPHPHPAHVQSAPDAELAVAARDGRTDALAELYRRHGDALLAAAYRLLGSVPAAEDVLHDLFVGLPDALRRYEERGTLGAWLRLITVRLALRTLRNEARRAQVDLDPHAWQHAAEAHELPEGVVALQGAIDQLPNALRIVVLLKYVEGYTHAEIGALLEISAGASEVRLVRAMKHLRAILGEHR